jgi:hypothetical protein
VISFDTISMGVTTTDLAQKLFLMFAIYVDRCVYTYNIATYSLELISMEVTTHLPPISWMV